MLLYTQTGLKINNISGYIFRIIQTFHVYNAVDTDYPLDRLVCPIETRSTSHQRIYTFRFRCTAKRDMWGLCKLLTNGNSPSLLAY